MEIYQNDFFVFSSDANNDVYISVKEKGFDIKDLNDVLQTEPRIVIKHFIQLREALNAATGQEIKVGILIDRVQLFISKDKMKADIKLNIHESELAKNKSQIISEIVEVLKKNQIKEGIITNVFLDGLVVGKKILIAQGIEPINGVDAKVTYFQTSERKPVIREDDRADYYELQFIDQIKTGDWLGEKMLPTAGTPGRTITGEKIPSKKGKDIPLRYDRKTVMEFEEENKIVLRAGMNGAVEFQNGKIAIQNHLVINGDVNTGTGNIEFDGSITITGTINNGFSVVATNDISVLSELGIGKVAKIISRDGDIFIKGGVSGSGVSVLEARKNIFVKYANECTLRAKESINIGLYSIGSILESKNIILDKDKGRIVGGSVKAKVQVASAVIGNQSGRKTFISVEGFDRNAVIVELNLLLQDYKEMLSEAESLKREIDVFESIHGKLDLEQMQEYIQNLEKYDQSILNVYKLEQRRQALMNYLEAKGEGQVSISRKAFPQTVLQIKAFQKKLEKITTGTFYAVGQKLHFE